jgi:hypothetical protein
MKVLTIVLFVIALSIAAPAQRHSGKGVPVGTVYGDILIREVSGNNLGYFSCANLAVRVTKLGGGWQELRKAMGNFSDRRCTFEVGYVRAGDTFVAVLEADFPHGCDLKSFETTTSFPMKVKAREGLRYNFAVSKIRCVLVK